MQVFDDECNILPDGEAGEICIKGRNVFEHYYNQSIERVDGFFRTGDIGFLRNRHLYIIGRKKDIVFIHGHNYYATDFERIVSRKYGQYFSYYNFIGSRKANGGDELVFFFYHKRTREIIDILRILHEFKRWFNKIMGFPINKIIRVKYRYLPKTTSGKIMRYRLTQLYRQGFFNENIIKEV